MSLRAPSVGLAVLILTGSIAGAQPADPADPADPAKAGAEEEAVDPEPPSARPHHMQLELGLFGGVFRPHKEHEFYEDGAFEQQPLRRYSPDLGARVGFYPLSTLGVEAEASVVLAETRGSGERVDLLGLRVQGVFQLPARVTPFVLGGIGSYYTTSDALGKDRDIDWHVGGGLKVFLTRRLQLRAEARLFRANRLADGADDNGEVNHYGVTGGLAWSVGGSRPVVRRPLLDAPEVGDRDGDGMDDEIDRCPDKAESVNGHDDTDGCPDELPDPDGDGLRADADRCPDAAEDADGFQDDDGCTDPDNDADALLDPADGCPDEAGPAENRGCPEKDRDGDKVVDRLDNCPDEAGVAEHQGCKQKQLVVITQNQLKILDKVFFKTGKAVLDRRSYLLLDNVASVMSAHPEITRVRVEGHTDDKGRDDRNRALSQKRAEAVAIYLVNRGVAPGRLEPIGYGEEKPIADNSSASGRAENRRVEFNIVVAPAEGAPQTAPPATPAPATTPAPSPQPTR